MYVGDTPDLAIHPAPLVALYVPRRFLREEFGGSDQQLLQYLRPTDGSARGRSLVFPQPNLNPFLPPHPGAAGLVFASRTEIVDSTPWALFCKDNPSGAAVWRYMGDYRSEVRGQPTVEQVRSQKPEVCVLSFSPFAESNGIFTARSRRHGQRTSSRPRKSVCTWRCGLGSRSANLACPSTTRQRPRRWRGSVRRKVSR
jgi:hypothetical protein